MRRVLAIAAVLTLAGCGASGGSDAGTTTVTPAETTTTTIATNAEAPAAGRIEDVAHQLEAAGMTCGASRPAPDSEGSMGGTDPQSEIDCTDGEVPVLVSWWANTTQAQATMASSMALICSYGITNYSYVAKGQWAAGANTESDVSDAEITATNERIADATGGKVVPPDC